jgi:hypothetical protein
VYERAGEGNNTTASATTVFVTHADLAVDNVTPPASPVQSGATIPVAWRGRSQGTGPATPPWTDAVYLSTDGTLSGDDRLLGELRIEDAVPVGQTYDRSLAVTLPNGMAGTYYLLVAADAEDDVAENAGEGDNAAASPPLLVNLAPYADLAVAHVLAPEVLIGDAVDLTVTWKVENQGTGGSLVDRWWDRVVLSPDETLGNSDDWVLGQFEHVGLMPQGQFYERTEIIPLPARTQGHFRLFVATDVTDLVYEHMDAGPNVAMPGHPVDIATKPFADLVVDDVTADANGISGQPVSVTWMISNVGPGATDRTKWTDAIYLSADPSGATGMRRIGTFTHLGILGPGDGYTRTAQVVLPANVSGPQYLFVRTGGPYEFVHTDNNQGRSGAVAVTLVPLPQVDLEVTSVSAPTSARESQQVEVHWTVRNHGPDDVTAAWSDRLSLAAVDNPAVKYPLGIYQHTAGLAAGMSTSRTELITLPRQLGTTLLVGQFLFFVETDYSDQLEESDEINNLLFSQVLSTTYTPRLDLQVTALDAPGVVTAGSVIDVAFTVLNLGTAATPTGQSRWTDRVFISFDNQLGGDIPLGALDNGSALDVSQAYQSTATFRLPQALSGNVYVLVQADSSHAVDEFPQEGNNTLAVPIAIDAVPVPPPDLVVEDVQGPVDAFDNSNITVRYAVASPIARRPRSACRPPPPDRTSSSRRTSIRESRSPRNRRFCSPSTRLSSGSSRR